MYCGHKQCPVREAFTAIDIIIIIYHGTQSLKNIAGNLIDFVNLVENISPFLYHNKVKLGAYSYT